MDLQLLLAPGTALVVVDAVAGLAAGVGSVLAGTVERLFFPHRAGVRPHAA